MRGKRRGVIIRPKLSFNSRWFSIEEKVRTFINSDKKKRSIKNHRLVNRDIRYAIVIKGFKWANKESKVSKKEEGISVGR